MSKHRKRWTSQEKLEIVNYYKQDGLTKTRGGRRIFYGGF